MITQYPSTKIIGESFVARKPSVVPIDIKKYPIMINKMPPAKII